MASRERVPIAAIAAIALACAAMPSRAASQECSAAELATVDAWLAQHPWRVGATSPDALVDAVCKPSPADKRITLVAAAYDRGTPYDKNLVVALVTDRVVSVFTGAIEEDASLMLARDSLRLDTARYDLAPGVRAFGVDVSSAKAGPHCADGGSGTTRTLFVRDSTRLRPVLSGVVLESWHVEGGSPPCAEIDPDTKGVGVIAESTTTLAVAPRATHGFADIVLTRRIDIHPGHDERAVLHYDGSTYAGPGFETRWPGIVPDSGATH